MTKGIITLSATAGGGNIGDRVWVRNTKRPKDGVYSWDLGTADTTWDRSLGQNPSQTNLWIEGITRSGACRDITLEITFTAAGAEPLVDRVNLTVFEVTTLTPAGAGSVKVMISTAHDNAYWTPSQTQDGVVWIEAIIEPAEADVVAVR